MIVIHQEPLTEELKKKVYEGFSRHALRTIGHDEKLDPVAFTAMDGSTFVGTVVVMIFWGALHIKYVYVEEEYRGKGVATSLMDKVFQYAQKHNCPFAYVETMSFQAQGFYQKLGFETELTRTGFAHGTSFHYLKKVLQHPDGP